MLYKNVKATGDFGQLIDWLIIWVILCLQFRETRSLYVPIYIFVLLFLSSLFLHTFLLNMINF